MTSEKSTIAGLFLAYYDGLPVSQAHQYYDQAYKKSQPSHNVRQHSGEQLYHHNPYDDSGCKNWVINKKTPDLFGGMF